MLLNSASTEPAGMVASRRCSVAGSPCPGQRDNYAETRGTTQTPASAWSRSLPNQLNNGYVVRTSEMGIPAMTPEQLLKSFQDWASKSSDRQFSDGIPIIHAWILLRSRPGVSQTEFDGLIRQFETAEDAGSHLHDLWQHVVHWGRELGLSVPSRNPWARAARSEA